MFCEDVEPVTSFLDDDDGNTTTIGTARISTILLRQDYRDETAVPMTELARLLAHEMQHIRQYNRWGLNGFACRYSNEVLAGRGSRRGNEVEDEAYEFSDHVEACLVAGEN